MDMAFIDKCANNLYCINSKKLCPQENSIHLLKQTTSSCLLKFAFGLTKILIQTLDGKSSPQEATCHTATCSFFLANANTQRLWLTYFSGEKRVRKPSHNSPCDTAFWQIKANDVKLSWARSFTSPTSVDLVARLLCPAPVPQRVL